jgi:EAL domain-containing protein (putative c-di-GMP-specific phosphodiesterase class I)
VPQYRLPAHQRLSHALGQDEFRIFYQPIADLRSGALVGAEALCRWPQHGGSFTPPESSIPQAESTGVIIALGEWVLRKASEQLRVWQREVSAHAEESIGIMRQIKGPGATLALDDFGTGYSSLTYLKRLPIDKSFVGDIPDDANDLAIVSAIIATAHALGLKVHAEGLETQPQADFLRDAAASSHRVTSASV